MHALISGYFGFGNSGDNWILQSQIERLTALGFTKFTIAGGPRPVSWVGRNATWIDRSDLVTLESYLKDSDLVVLGGGGLFQEHHGLRPLGIFPGLDKSNAVYLQIPLLAKASGKPVAYLDHGVGPIFTEAAAQFLRFAYGLADFITVRDRSSLDLLRAVGIENAVLSCDAVISKRDTSAKSGRTIKTIGVACRAWEKEGVARVGAALKALSNSWPEPLTFVHLPFFCDSSAYSDLAVSQAFIQMGLPGSIVDLSQLSYAQSINVLETLDLLITSRYHGLVCALNLGLPALSITVDLKLSDFVGENNLASLALWPEQLSNAGLLEKMQSLAMNSASVAQALVDAKYRLLLRREEADSSESEFVARLKDKKRISYIEKINELPSISQFRKRSSAIFKK